MSSNDKNQLQGFMACQQVEALDVLKGWYAAIKKIPTDIFAQRI